MTDKNKHKYKVKYKLEADYGEFTKKQINKDGSGGCDAFIFFSLIYPEDGSYSQMFYSHDGRNKGKELDANELWKVWSMMTKNLIDRKDDLADWKFTIVDATWELIQQMMTL